MFHRVSVPPAVQPRSAEVAVILVAPSAVGSAHDGGEEQDTAISNGVYGPPPPSWQSQLPSASVTTVIYPVVEVAVIPA